MFKKSVFIVVTLVSLLAPYAVAQTDSIDPKELHGNWHLRIMDGMEVRKARAILDFDMEKMTLNGFDACNRIAGKLEVNSDTNMTAKLRVTRMACRQSIHSYVSKRLHETIDEGFNISEGRRNGVEGITLKSSSHELFFGRMGK